jgi:cytochrome c
MKKFLISIFVLLVIGFGVYSFFFVKEKFLSVLVFSKTEQFRHQSIEVGIQAIKGLGNKYSFPVDATEDASIFTEKNLKKYNVVVFLNTTGDILNDAQQLEFNRFIQAGGGFVGIHAATDTEYNWEWYGKLVGAYFNGHPNNPNVREADIQVVQSEHISTKGLPQKWHCIDEWYNFKNINPNVEILLNLDENSYEGGTNGESHPIAWCHEFDGGRSWYTGRGHTNETFEEVSFLEHLWGGIDYVSERRERVNYNNANVAPEENRFIKEVLLDNLNEPMELELLPDGKVIFVERGGKIKVYDQVKGEVSNIHKLNVTTKHEDGLLGIALDPNIKENNWVYLFYSDPEKIQQNISRFTLKDNFMTWDTTSEKVLLEIATQRDECCHSGGSLEFGPDGYLFISTGDDTNPHESDGYSPSDERKNRSPWDAQKSSANSMDLRGKILRIKPEADGTYSIPNGNLFSKDGSIGRPEIYVMGCRNPFRIAIDSHTGFLYWGDVGPDAGEDSLKRGPMGFDEVNQAREAGFFGWPYFIGDNQVYHKYDFENKISLEPFDLKTTINNSPNNKGVNRLPAAQPAFIWYPYGESKEFPSVGDGGRNAMAGPVFYAEDYIENKGRYPEYYNGKLFIYDWMRGWIMAVTMADNGDFERMEPFLPSFEFNNLTDMLFSPEGDIYLLEYGTAWFSENPDSRLVHLKYNSGNRAPVANFKSDRGYGKLPLTIQFDASSSIDYDGDKITYQWFFGDSESVGSTENNPIYTFRKPGQFPVKLITTDVNGEKSEMNKTITAGNALPVISWSFSGNKTFYWDNQELNYEVDVTDEEDGSLSNGIDPNRVSISIDHLERGFDKNEIAIGHQALQEASEFLLGKQLMEKSDCRACHQLNSTSVGPSYIGIAEKYKSDSKAVDYLSDRVIKGGGGVWGETVMAAHPQLSESEVIQMAKYILSLADRTDLSNSLPTKGKFVFNNHQPNNLEGKYILTASYKDKGGDQVGSLTSRQTIALRYAKMKADEFDESEKASRFTVDPEMAQGMIDEPLDLVFCESNGYILYKNIDFTSVKSIAVEYVKAGPMMDGGSIDFKLDSKSGISIGQLDFNYGMTEMGGDQQSFNLPGIEGSHDLYLVINAAGDRPITGLVSLHFKRETAVQ